jgi:hypothetical protein
VQVRALARAVALKGSGEHEVRAATRRPRRLAGTRLEELGASATKLEGLLLTVNQEAPRVAALLGDATRLAAGQGHALVEFAFWRALALVLSTVGAALVAALAYRWAAIRMARSHIG